MPIILDHQLREQIPHKATEFPVTYFHDELAEFPNWAAPFHWHPDFEIATAVSGVLDYQVGSSMLPWKPVTASWSMGTCCTGSNRYLATGQIRSPLSSFPVPP